MGKELCFRFDNEDRWIDWHEIVFSSKKVYFHGSWNDFKEAYHHAMDINDWWVN